MERLAVRTGIDLVEMAAFQRAVQRGGDAFLRRVFHPSETAGAGSERLAGIFAAKEAAFKALALPKGDWHVVEVRHDQAGRPFLAFAPEFDSSHIVSCDVSISHAGGYAAACVMALVRG